MNRFRSRRLTLLIATDVAARGLDVSHVDMVFNYELPFEDEIYVHRIGRTGRAGLSGKSISFVYPSMRGKLFMIEKFIKQQMVELEIPTLIEIKAKQEETLFEQIKHETDTNEANYDMLIAKFVELGYDKDDIISALIEKLSVQTKTYEDISKPRTRQDFSKTKDNSRSGSRNRSRSASRDQSRGGSRSGSRDQTNRRDDSSKQYSKATINLGKNDGLRAPHLLDYFKKNADMYPSNIGDINISDDHTDFEIHVKAVKRLDQLTDKVFKGRKLKFKITKK
jgi:ATP-dependent RNA helicase DeaD